MDKIDEVRERSGEILNSLLHSQRLMLEALEDCDDSKYDASMMPLDGLSEKIEEIDQLILTIMARYSPEAKDLREMVAFLKITDAMQRIATNEKNYIKNMEICRPELHPEMKEIITTSLSINRCTIKALEYAVEMIHETEDRDRLKELESKIKVEASKTDDIYSMIEKELLQNMKIECLVDDDHIILMKYIRKNLKIIGRLEDIAEKLLFARLGGGVLTARSVLS